MNKFYRLTAPILKIYAAVILIAAAIFSQPWFAIIPILLMVVTLFLWWRPISTSLNLLADFFSFFSIAILITPVTGPVFALLLSLPVLVLVTRDMETASEAIHYRKTGYPRYFTRLGFTLPLIAIMALIIGTALDNLSMILSSTMAILYLGILITHAFLIIPPKPIETSPVHQRILAGDNAKILINLTSKTKSGGLLFLKSPYEWLKLDPLPLPMKKIWLSFEISLSPPLSGPSVIKLEGYALDRWGLTQTRFEFEPLRLHVIPRARYASWLAKRYITETRAGSLPLISNVGTIRPLYGLRSGIEYYGSQLYQPGDSLKNIDWKHSIRYDRLITKEFSEFRGQPAVLLVNLAVNDANEADKQVYQIIVAALSLAREQIPTSLAAYDQEEVKLITPTLQPRMLVAQALEITDRIVTIGKSVKYLKSADVKRLRANINRLQFVEDEPAKVLSGILKIEYTNLKSRAQVNPASKALSMISSSTGKQSSVVVVSPLNHDAEAIMFGAINYENKGNRLIVL
ncbi:MAG: DUF58 domain-containing protein [Dehalococcoidales bacterium]|nr:DUF58 domain-containing protein [Dehalococcoidales bacterium]